jgi:hypothetical protein
MPNTFELIASYTVGAGGAASIDFTSIASTWTDLVIKCSLRSTSGGGEFGVQFNGATTGYTDRYLQGSGSAATSGNDTSKTYIYGGEVDYSTYTSNTFSNGEIYIPNYAGSTYKSVSIDNVTENNATASWAHLSAGLWSNTAAITTVKIMGGVTFAQYSTAYLYGVKNA